MTTAQHKKRIAIANLAQGGGDGKTWTSQLMITICKLLDIELLVLDADQGNRALSLLEPNAQAIDIMEEPKVLLGDVLQSLPNGEAVVLDLGANTFADSVNFLNFLFQLGFELQDRGYSVHALWIVSTNKVGAAEGLKPIARQYESAYSPVWVFNDRDASGNMPEGFQPAIVVRNLHPGFVSLVNEGGGFLPLIRDGKPGYQLSCNHVAAYVWRFANQSGIRNIFGDEAIDSLEPILNRNVPSLDPFRIEAPMDDDELIAKATRAEVGRVVMPLLHDVDALISALIEFKRDLI